MYILLVKLTNNNLKKIYKIKTKLKKFKLNVLKNDKKSRQKRAGYTKKEEEKGIRFARNPFVHTH